MGTRADFYIGRGENAEWIGSVGHDGHPDHDFGTGRELKKLAKGCTKREYERAVKKWLGGSESGVFPADGWPWPWKNSLITDYTYAYERGQIYVLIRFTKGEHWVRLSEVQKSEPDDVTFPDMTAKRNMNSPGAVRSSPMLVGQPR